MANGTQDREDIEVVLGGTPYTINVPKGLKDDEIITKAMSQDKEFAEAYRNHKMFGDKPVPGTIGGSPPPVPNIREKTLPSPVKSERTSSQAVFKPAPKSLRQSFLEGPSAAARGGYMLPRYESPEEAQMGAEQGLLGVATQGASIAGEGLGLPLIGRAALQGAATGGAEATSEAMSDKKMSPFNIGMSAIAGGSSEYLPKVFGPFLKRGPKAPVLEEAIPASEAELAEGIVKGGKELLQLGDAEAGLRTSISGAPAKIQKNVINKAYQEVQGADVDLLPVAEKAAERTAKLQGHGAPPAFNKLLKLNQSVKDAEKELADLEAGGLDDPEVKVAQATLDKLKDGGKIPIREAIQLRSALSRITSTMRRSSLPTLEPGEVWHAAKNVKSSLDEAIDTAVTNPDALKKADALARQRMEDFFNVGAPLRGVVNAKEDMVGRTLDNLLKPANLKRAQEALRGWGMNDEADVLKNIANMPNVDKKVAAMKKLIGREEGWFGEKMMTAKASDVKRVEKVSERNAIAQKKFEDARAELRRQRSVRLKALLYGAIGYTIGSGGKNLAKRVIGD